MSKPQNKMLRNVGLVFLLIVLFILIFGGGTTFWLFDKAKKAADSASHVSGITNVATDDTPESTTLLLLSKDSAGKDLTGVPRYPGAIRSNYYVSDDKNFSSVEYIAPDTQEKIADYYKSNLDPAGWVVTASDSKTVTFLKEGNDLTLEFIASNDKTPVITQYSLNLTLISN